jgi:two-component system, OmpR family, response regulator
MSLNNLAETVDKNSLKKKILIAEDDASMRRLVEVVLRQAGFEVFTAEDGLKALEIALDTEIDAVIADAIMPNMTGYDLCRMLRANAAKKHVQLVILSGLTGKSPDHPDNNLADAFLVKDTNLKEQLLLVLQKLL